MPRGWQTDPVYRKAYFPALFHRMRQGFRPTPFYVSVPSHFLKAFVGASIKIIFMPIIDIKGVVFANAPHLVLNF